MGQRLQVDLAGILDGQRVDSQQPTSQWIEQGERQDRQRAQERRQEPPGETGNQRRRAVAQGQGDQAVKHLDQGWVFPIAGIVDDGVPVPGPQRIGIVKGCLQVGRLIKIDGQPHYGPGAQQHGQ